MHRWNRMLSVLLLLSIIDNHTLRNLLRRLDNDPETLWKQAKLMNYQLILIWQAFLLDRKHECTTNADCPATHCCVSDSSKGEYCFEYQNETQPCHLTGHTMHLYKCGCSSGKSCDVGFIEVMWAFLLQKTKAIRKAFSLDFGFFPWSLYNKPWVLGSASAYILINKSGWRTKLQNQRQNNNI